MSAIAVTVEGLEVPRHRLRVADYHKMIAAGVLGKDDRIELIDGELIEMAPIGDAHAGITNQLNYLLTRRSGEAYLVGVQTPLVLDAHNEPEPDLLVLRWRADFYKYAKPTAADVCLLIEIADSSLTYDQTVKLPLYALHGIPEIWLINLPQRRFELYRAPRDGRYERRDYAEIGMQAWTDSIAGIVVDVGEVLGF